MYLFKIVHKMRQLKPTEESAISLSTFLKATTYLKVNHQYTCRLETVPSLSASP